ncbi:IclR family transcriptional regulator [Streptomyces sp. NPDC059909]|uniref:IclR family transcriptional regulator n=1 Tax=Streptomyces sp. NPDC059909 TaxID=3346998 RepID=UPI003660E9D8
MAGGRAGADSGRRALEVLFAFAEQRPVASVRELADAVGIPVPTAHRYVALLRDMALVEEDTRGYYRLTMRVAALGRAARQGTSLAEVADPFLRALADEVSETVLLIRLVRGLPVCVHGAESSRPYRLSFEVGQNLPPLRGASARVLLGGLSPAERERYVDRALESGAVPPLHGREEFLQGVELAVKRGWSVSHEEIDEGIWAVSAAIRDDDRTVATLSLSCPEFRLDDARRKAYTDRAVATAERISEALRGGAAAGSAPGNDA